VALGLAAGARAQYGRVEQWAKPRLNFAAIGLNHSHIVGQCNALIRGGGALAKFHAAEDDLAAEFQAQFPQALRVADEREILEDGSIALVASASIPDERAPLGIRAMRAGKDFMSDKPGATSHDQLAELRRVQAETGRIYSIAYSERFDNHATVKASELVAAGAIGRVIQTVGLGPHRLRPETRPEWFWDKARFGGILCDIASHQIDQFLHFTGSTEAEVTAAQVANFHHRDRPEFEDFGDVMLRGNGGAGYCRVDWFTPGGIEAFGDGRLTIIGTDGFIELRKYADPGGLPGGSHLILVDQKGVTRIQPGGIELPYGRQLVDDVLNRTETAMTQAHCFLATELALKAQAIALRIG
jgi:predicted dehydrogenase